LIPETGELTYIGFNEPVISPDKQFFLSFDDTVNGPLTLYELQSGLSNELSSGVVTCVEWSPDSKKFNAVVDGVLSVYDTQGNQTQIFESPSADIGDGNKRIAQITCGKWMGANKIVIQNYDDVVYPLKDEPGPDANTTTLVNLDPTPELIKAPKRWFVHDTCTSGEFLLVSDAEGNMNLAQSFHSWDEFNPQDLSIQIPDANDPFFHKTMVSRRIGFVPGSPSCELYYQDMESGQIFIIDAVTLEKRMIYKLQTNRAAVEWDGNWVEYPANQKIIIFEREEESFESMRHLILVNLVTGEQVEIGTYQPSHFLNILDWLP